MSITHRFPVATLVLIAISIGAAFVGLFQPDMVESVGFVSTNPAIPKALFSLFVHVNLIHLFSNMVFLAAVGPAVEMAAGTVRFLIVYLVGGLGGVLAHYLLARTADVPLVGASGAIAALVGYYSVRYFNLRVPIAPNLGVPVAAMAIVWALLQLIGAVWTLGAPSMGGSAYWAHLGGLATGFLLSLAFGAPRLADLELGHEALDRMNQRSPAARLSAAEHLLAKHPKDPRALREKAEAHALLGEPDAEAETLITLLDLTPELEQGPILGRLGALGHLEILPSIRRSLLADRFKFIDVNLSQSLLKSIITTPSDPQRPDALLALFGIDQNEEWIEVLTREYPLHPATEIARHRGLCP